MAHLVDQPESYRPWPPPARAGASADEPGEGGLRAVRRWTRAGATLVGLAWLGRPTALAAARDGAVGSRVGARRLCSAALRAARHQPRPGAQHARSAEFSVRSVRTGPAPVERVAD